MFTMAEAHTAVYSYSIKSTAKLVQQIVQQTVSTANSLNGNQL